MARKQRQKSQQGLEFEVKLEEEGTERTTTVMRQMSRWMGRDLRAFQ